MTGCQFLKSLLDDPLEGRWTLLSLTNDGETTSVPYEICIEEEYFGDTGNVLYSWCAMLSAEMEIEELAGELEGTFSVVYSNDDLSNQQIYDLQAKVTGEQQYDINIVDLGGLECELFDDSLECEDEDGDELLWQRQED